MLPVQNKTSKCTSCTRPFLVMHRPPSRTQQYSLKVSEGKLGSDSVHCSGQYLPDTQLWIPVQKTTVCQLAGLTSVLRHIPPRRRFDIHLQKGLYHSCHIQRILSKCFCNYIHSCTQSHLTTYHCTHTCVRTHTHYQGKCFQSQVDTPLTG